jgi:hypothetical protein
MTNEEHNKYIGIAFLIHAGFQLFWMLAMGLMMFLFFSAIPTKPGEPAPPKELFAFFFLFMLVFQVIFTAPSAVAGYALLKRKPWARMAAIIGSVLAAMSVPIGTATCIYAMWFFVGDKWKGVYPEAGNQLGGSRAELPIGKESPWWADQAARRERAEAVRPPDWR